MKRLSSEDINKLQPNTIVSVWRFRRNQRMNMRVITRTNSRLYSGKTDFLLKEVNGKYENTFTLNLGDRIKSDYYGTWIVFNKIKLK